jgi:CheY-like chemotaxis protein
MMAHPVTILLVEDDPGHARLIEKNLQRANLSNEFVIVTDGQQALDFVFCEGEHRDIDPHSPQLILLDLNLPILDGYQVLVRIKTHEATKHIPVVILTTTDDPREMTKCYEFGCNVYLIKPVDYECFSNAIRQLGLFLSVVEIPSRKR